MDTIKNLSISVIIDPENPMRTGFDRDSIWDLAESIKREGLINPITVRPKGDMFEVVAGHRRFTAAKLAGLVELPCVIRVLDDAAAFEVMAHENLHRQDVDPVDEAIFLGRLIGEDGSKIKQVADNLNRSVKWVEDRLEILEYPEYMLGPIRDGALSLGVAHYLGAIGDDFWRQQYLQMALTQGMSILQAKYVFNQWELGLLKSPDETLPATEQIISSSPQRAKTICVRCGQIAEDPNLQLVFIHRECPPPADSALAAF